MISDVGTAMTDGDAGSGSGPAGSGPSGSGSSGSRPFEDLGRKLDERLGEAAARGEGEVRHIINYLNDEVIPELHRNSSAALRSASAQLQRLAERLDAHFGYSAGGKRPGGEQEP